MPNIDGSRLNDDAENEEGRRNQNAVLSRAHLGHKARENGTQPGAELENRREPSLLRRVVDITAHVCEVPPMRFLALEAQAKWECIPLGYLSEALTLSKRMHGQDAREHALVVAVEDAADAGKGRDARHLEVLDKGPRSAGTHQGLAPRQGHIVGGVAVAA